MFYYKTSFSKKAIFLKKTAKIPFVGGQDCFKGKGRLATKINIIFFVGIDVLNIFYLTSFSKKTIFSKITAKNYFWGHSEFYLFWGEMGNRIRFLSFFLKKPVPSDLIPKNWFWGYIFPHICGSIVPIVSKNNRVHTWVDPHQPCEFHKNRFKTATCIVRSISHIYIKRCGFLIRDLQNEKRDHPLPPSEVERVKIVVISFRNIAKNLLFYSVIFNF